MKAFLVKIQEGFKSLGLASQLGITLGLSLAMLAGVYGISQAMSPMQKVTQVVEVQTSAPTNSSTPSSSTEKKEVAEKKKETTQAPTTESVTTEKQVVTEEEKNTREVQGNVAQATPSQERRREESENGPQTREATPTEAPTVTSSSETVATPPQRLKPLGNTGQEFATLEQAEEWMKKKLEQSARDQKDGKQNWAYSGRAYEIPWSDGSKTATVDLTKIESHTPAPPSTETTSSETAETPGTDHL